MIYLKELLIYIMPPLFISSFKINHKKILGTKFQPINKKVYHVLPHNFSIISSFQHFILTYQTIFLITIVFIDLREVFHGIPSGIQMTQNYLALALYRIRAKVCYCLAGLQKMPSHIFARLSG